MLNTILNAVIGLGQSKLRNTVIAGCMLGGLPTAAFAHHHGFHVDIEVPGPQVLVPVGPCNAAPVQLWVPAVYRAVTDRIWIAPVTATQFQRVEIPAEYGYRDVIVYDRFGRPRIRRDQVEITPARCEDRPVQVEVSPGHFEFQTHQQLVCEGHWETQVQQPVVVVEPARARLEIPLPF